METEEWNKLSCNLLKSELAKAGIGYEELIKRLAEIGVTESYKGIANKINRGTFSFSFFMQCMKALSQKTIRFEE